MGERLVVMSCFRSCAGAPLQRYFRQIAALAAVMPLRLIAIEGDSVDQTRTQLETYLGACGVPFEFVIREHGGPWYGSVDCPPRMQQLAFVVNGGLERLTPDDDVVVYIESDLIWRPEPIVRLVAQLRPGFDVIAPAVFAGEAFYDIWAFRGTTGTCFGPFHPYWSGLRFDQPTEVLSVGSCLVMRGDVARAARLSETDALVGFCRDARRQGFHIFADFRERIEHP